MPSKKVVCSCTCSCFVLALLYLGLLPTCLYALRNCVMPRQPKTVTPKCARTQHLLATRALLLARAPPRPLTYP
jgi:hypothetical protein